jgi:type IV pilus assembly protein PilM
MEANFLNNIMGSFFARKGDRVLGVDIGSSAIKAVQARKVQGRAVLETYGTLALGPYNDTDVGRTVQLPRDKVVAAMRDLFREAGVTTTECAMSLPIQTSLIAFIDMPDLPERQLASMIPIEARKYIPVPIDEVSLDWMLLPYEAPAGESGDEDDNKTREGGKRVGVMLVAIHNEALEQYRGIADDLKLNVRFLELETFSAIRSAITDQSGAPTLIFDMGAGATKFYLVESGAIRNSHSVNRGAQEITTALAVALGIPFSEAESLKRSVGLKEKLNNRPLTDFIPLPTEYMFSEASKVLLNYQKRYNKVVRQIILIGGGVLLPGFLEYTAKQLDAEIVLGEPFARFGASSYLEPLLKEAGPEFAVSAGLAIRALQEMP